MKLGIIGTGTIVEEFLPKLKKLEGIEVLSLLGTKRSTAVVERLCSENDIPYGVYTFEALVATGIDTVYVAVPNFLHYMYCKQALENGLNVIVEKPMASNLKESMLLQELTKEKGLFLFEAITTLYLGNFKKIAELLPRIGGIKLVQSQYSHYSRRYDAFRSGEILPAFDPKKAGGALMDLNLYNLHFVMGLFGSPQSVQYYANVERGIDTSGFLALKYPSFQALCLAAKDSNSVFGSVIQGTDGYIKTSCPPNIIGKVTLKMNDGTVEEYDDGMGAARLIPEFTAFVDAINTGNRAFCYNMLEKSINVSRIQTEARLMAGISFPADEEGLTQ